MQSVAASEDPLRALTLTTISVVFCTAIIARTAFIIFFPGTGGDSESYLLTAQNIVSNLCISYSDPASGQCVPHWGGNQLPGYPAFVAAIWWIFGENQLAIRLAQAVLAAGAIIRLVYASRLFLQSDFAALLVGLFVALSPLMTPWPRFLLTESLTISVTTWVFAELIASLAEKRLRLIPLALSSILAIYLRYDSALLAIPIAVCGIYIHGPLAAIRKGVVLAVIVALPICFWIARNIAVGISPLPPYFVTAEKGHFLEGYVRWGMTWEVDQYDLPNWWWPAARKNYSQIVIPTDAFHSEGERKRVLSLLNELSHYFENRPMPSRIESAFREIANEKRSNQPLRTWLVLPLRRAANLWLTPYASFGWPGEIGSDRESVLALYRRLGLVRASYEALKEHPQILAKIVPSIYRYTIIVGFFAIFIRYLTTLNSSHNRIRLLLFVAIAYSATRTIFFSYLYLHETRYILPSFIIIEICVAFVIAVYIDENIRRRSRRAPLSSAIPKW